MVSFSYFVVFGVLCSMNNPDKLKLLEKKLKQTENRLMLERNKRRFMETKQKRSYGKMFVIAGAGNHVDITVMQDRDIIEMGALVITAKCDSFNIGTILGALHLIFDKCQDSSFKSACVDLGISFYQTKKLSDPECFLLGVALSAKRILENTERIEKCKVIGDELFIENKRQKLERYKKYLAEKNASMKV